MQLRSLVAAAAALACGVGLAGCGSSDSSSSKGDIHIAMIVPTGTSGGNYPEEVSGARAAAKAINADGGVNGKNIVIDFCNEKIDPNAAAACARKAEAGDAIALLGDNSTNNAASVLPNLKTIPNIGPFALSPPDLACKTCYSYDSLALGEFMATGALIGESKADAVQLLTLDIPAGKAAYGGIQTALEKAGVNVKPIIYVPATTSDYSSYAQKVKDSGAKTIAPGLPASGVSSLLQALKQLDYKTTVITNDNQVPLEEIKALGSFVEGAQFAIPLPPPSSDTDYPAIKEWKADLAKQTKSGDKDASTLSSISLHAWLGVYAIANVAKTVDGKVDRTSFVSALKSAKNIDMKGLVPPWTPSAKAPTGMSPGFSTPLVWFATVKNGDLVLTNKDPWNLAQNKFTPVAAP